MEVLPTTVVQRLQQFATEHKVTKPNRQRCQPQSNGTRIQHCSCIDLCVYWWTRGFQNIWIPLYRFLIAWPLDMTLIDYYISFALNSHRQNKRILAHTCSPIFSEACTHSHSCALTLVRFAFIAYTVTLIGTYWCPVMLILASTTTHWHSLTLHSLTLANHHLFSYSHSLKLSVTKFHS